MLAYLNFSVGNGAQRLPCSVITTIGRDRSNTIVLADLQVSRHHALVRRLGAADYYLIDSGSANGSRINARRISTPTLLQDGDTITIGTTQFRFEQPAHSHALKDSVSLQQTVIAQTPQIQEITILVADIRGFTTLSEHLPIQTLTRVMSAWFEQVSHCIETNRGTIDKFIGDCVFARWDSRDNCINVAHALRTACKVSDITTALSGTFSELNTPLTIGAGINTGLAAMGMGSENTALGDAVNTAFRLESATKELGADIVLSESSYRCLPENHWRGMEQTIKLKGKHKPVTVVALDFDRVSNWLSAQTGM